MGIATIVKFSREFYRFFFSMIRNLKRVYSSYKCVPFLFKSLNLPKQYFSKSVSSRFTMETIDLDQLRAAVTKQGGVVRQLKKDGASSEEVTAGLIFFLLM